METKNYNCKNEELPVIGGFVLFAYRRDQTDFAGFAPKFTAAYGDLFDAKIKATAELLNPKAETAELKLITSRLYTTVDDLIGSINNLATYVKMAGTNIPLSAYDFGFTFLRNKIHGRDVEGVLQGLRLVNVHILKYKDALMAQGVTQEFIDKLDAAAASIAADNQLQYEIKENRKALVQSNTRVFNDLYADIAELCEVGKNLYRGNDPKKLSEYTFSNLLKNVRVLHKTKVEKKTDEKTDDQTDDKK
jgi:hypothetical protein